jgi:dUTP pyrophosphatase
MAGVIDCGFNGVIKIMLFNHGQCTFAFSKGDRLAQAIPIRIYDGPVYGYDGASLVGKLDKLTFEKQRGEGGFGSTGGFKGADEKKYKP